MHAILQMKGPRIDSSAVLTDAVDNVNLYPMFCALLRINPAPNNGSTLALAEKVLLRK
jgi:hypothetical protein